MNTENLSKRDSTSPQTQKRRTVAPPVDVFENKDELVILADLPGVTKEALAIHFDKDQLVIEGKRAFKNEKNEAEGYDYRRTFSVPRGIDAERISANLQGGVLKVTLPKPAALKPRQIEVKVG